MKTDSGRDHELNLWKGMGGATIGVLLAHLLLLLVSPLPADSRYSLLLWTLCAVWFVAGPVLYFIDVRPRKRREREQARAKRDST
jgi:Na+/melibiose symporter-like transporter